MNLALRKIVLALALIGILSSEAEAMMDPTKGRWLSRDPIEERGGLNLSLFSRNDGINLYDALGLALSPYTFNVSELVWIQDDLSKRGKGAVTDIVWPDSVATASGKFVKIEGELNLRYFYHTDKTPSSIGVDKLSFREHEGFHATIAKIFWNANMKLVNQWEGEYCTDECARIAADIANQTNLYNDSLQDESNHGFDVKQYGSNESADSDIRERNQRAADRGKSDANIYKRNMEKFMAKFAQLSCSGPKK